MQEFGFSFPQHSPQLTSFVGSPQKSPTFSSLTLFSELAGSHLESWTHSCDPHQWGGKKQIWQLWSQREKFPFLCLFFGLGKQITSAKEQFFLPIKTIVFPVLWALTSCRKKRQISREEKKKSNVQRHGQKNKSFKSTTREYKQKKSLSR